MKGNNTYTLQYWKWYGNLFMCMQHKAGPDVITISMLKHVYIYWWLSCSILTHAKYPCWPISSTEHTSPRRKGWPEGTIKHWETFCHLLPSLKLTVFALNKSLAYGVAYYSYWWTDFHFLLVNLSAHACQATQRVRPCKMELWLGLWSMNSVLFQ